MVSYCRSVIKVHSIIWDCFIAAPPITVKVTSNLNTPLMVGQTDNILTCDVSGADNLNPTIAYLWTRDDGHTQTQVGTNSNLTLSSLRFSHVGDYTCNVTIYSTLLNNNISTSSDNSQRLMIQSELNHLTIISWIFHSSFPQSRIHNLSLSQAALVALFSMDQMLL